MNPAALPLVYACSGCSSAAQMANHLALRLDREGVAEMSCISGVGGGVPALVRTAQSGRRILALDGCAMHCVAHCLKRAGVAADEHLVLGELGVRKRKHVATGSSTTSWWVCTSTIQRIPRSDTSTPMRRPRRSAKAPAAKVSASVVRASLSKAWPCQRAGTMRSKGAHRDGGGSQRNQGFEVLSGSPPLS